MSSLWSNPGEGSSGPTVGVHPSNPVAAGAGAAMAPLDPYYRWALATRWRGFERASRSPTDPPGNVLEDGRVEVQIVAQASSAAEVDKLAASALARVDAPYLRPIPGGDGSRSLYFTAHLRVDKLPTLAQQHTGLRWTLALPVRGAEAVAAASPHGYWARDRDRTAFRPPDLLAGLEVGAPPRWPPGVLDEQGRPRRAIAVIDDGCAFLHDAFGAKGGQGGHSRIHALWDQGRDRPPQGSRVWQATAAFGYGREAGAASLGAAWREIRRRSLDENAVYRGIDHLIAYDDPRRRVWFATHGTHVLDVAAGRVDPLTGESDRDAASKAPIVYVQLPALTAADGAGGSLAAHLLDAVRYVLEVCASRAKVALNISYGTHAGPHDGTSMFERALDELLRCRGDDFVIVLAAGNARRSRCHARREVRVGFGAQLQIELAAGDSTDTFVECWYGAVDGARLELRVRTPGRDWTDWVAPGGQRELRAPGGAEVLAMLRHDREVPNGARSMVLLAIAPTRATDCTPNAVAEPGVWDLELRLVDEDPRAADGRPRAVVVDAWIQRDDVNDRESGVASHFVGIDRGDEENTFNSLATGNETIVAGGFRRSTGRPAPYSSLPAPGVLPPLYVLAACEEDADLPSLRAAAVRSAEVTRMNGTSVAAPVLVRRLFNLMAGSRVPIARRAWADRLAELCRLDGDSVRRPAAQSPRAGPPPAAQGVPAPR